MTSTIVTVAGLIVDLSTSSYLFCHSQIHRSGTETVCYRFPIAGFKIPFFHKWVIVDIFHENSLKRAQ